MEQREEEISSLLLDNRFVDWIINPQSEYTEYWLQWIAGKPEHAAQAEEAKNILLELRKLERDNDLKVNWAFTGQIWESICNDIVIGQKVPQKKGRVKVLWYATAVAIVGIMVLTTAVIYRQKRNQLFAIPEKVTHSSHELIRYNGSRKSELVYLPDGSKVTLANGGRIAYNRLMNGRKRNVELSGDAFFDVSKDQEKPFLIYTKNIIIKVVGTSFMVKATSDNETVHVKTGTVAVYLKGQDIKGAPAKILLPGQACVWSAVKKELIIPQHMVPPGLDLETNQADEYDFEDVALDKVFKSIERMYALPVYYDSATFSNCFITISLGDESLEEKLQTITKTIGATFSMSENGISVDGAGCN